MTVFKYISVEKGWDMDYPYAVIGRYWNHADTLQTFFYEHWPCRHEALEYAQALSSTQDYYICVNDWVAEEALVEGVVTEKLVQGYAQIKKDLGY